jgi:hypothetical protein
LEMTNVWDVLVIASLEASSSGCSSSSLFIYKIFQHKENEIK